VERTYQFAATIAFPSGLTRLDLALILIFGIEERFFFFWSSRPMVCTVVELKRGLIWQVWFRRAQGPNREKNIFDACYLIEVLADV
jgi:hypothetical protein